MKILAIRGKNLASLEGEFIIDFRSEPLKSAGIFAITGSTGSGKSTLLDTMCIALFDKSPRIKKITDSTKIPDTEGETIHENDSRNILRRGCTNGYAECDFLALDGKEYRARWSVRRADNKVDGRLQKSVYALHCITDNSEIPGTKTELLKRVTELLGLTFDQFSRAVLLAQGDFATFLKASSREKSEILEKLTGTDLYSQISIKIFNKSKEADNNLAQIANRIEEIALLSDDEVKTLSNEQALLERERKESEKNVKALEKGIEWIERMTQLTAEEKSAEENIEKRQNELKALEPTINKLQEIESVQPIRDTYTNILALKRQIKESNEQQLQLIEQEKKENELFAIAEEELASLIEQQNKINDEWNETEPKIREAQKIESEINIHKKQLNENIAAVENEKKALTDCNKTLEEITDKAVARASNLKEIDAWQKSHSIEFEIVPNIESILQDIGEVEEADTLMKEKKGLRDTATTLLKSHEEQLQLAHKERERLNSTLTQEIATLRSRLVEGAPCPVCGSRHHEISTVEGSILEEELLVKAKSENENAINHLNISIEKCRTEIASLTASIEGYDRIYTVKRQRVGEQLQTVLPKKEITLNEVKSIAREIKKTGTEWSKKEQQKGTLEREKSAEDARAVEYNKRIQELQLSIEKKEKNCETLKQKITTQEKEIANLLGCTNNAQTVEKHFRERIKDINAKTTAITEKRNSLLIKVEKTRQQIQTLQHNAEQLSIRFESHKQQIETFLESQGQRMTLDILHKLATVAADEITSMRNSIEQAGNRLLEATTMLQERRRNVSQHLSSENRPDEKDTRDELTQRLSEFRKNIVANSERATEIAIILNNDKSNKIKSAELRKRHDEYKQIATNWNKLNALLGSSDGNKFRMIAQGYTLDIMLAYANRHLQELTNRYELARISPDSLAIKVIDLDMLSETRSVHSLSGGESFLVSLALALALSSLSSNKMSIESLFIDEGFGSLDTEVLSTAMDALERLHNQGRKIGVISHLPDIIERIPAQIRVIRSKEGKSSIKIR